MRLAEIVALYRTRIQPMRFDEHGRLRPHADEPVAHTLPPYCEAEQKKGIGISIKEHGPLPEKYQRGPRGDFYFAMSPNELEPFLDLFIGTEIPVGLELDYFSDAQREIKEIAEKFFKLAAERNLKIGALNGSVHLLPLAPNPASGEADFVMWDDKADSFDKYFEICGIERIIEAYHSALCGLVKMQQFDVLSHIDLLRKFDRLDKKKRSYYLEGFETFYEEAIFDVLQLAAENGIAVELNTPGVDRPYGRPFLTGKALLFCHEKQINITFASDAHRPESIGRHCEIAGEMFARAGVEKVAYFRNRKPNYYEFQ